MVCAKTRGLAAVPLYSFENAAAWPATLNSRTWTVTPVPVLRTAPITSAVGAELAPAIERHGVDRRRHRDRRVGVARNHVELALEVEVVPQHLADRRGDRLALGIGRRGEEVGHGELGLAAADAA